MESLPEFIRQGMEHGFVVRVEEFLTKLSDSVFQAFTNSVKVSTPGRDRRTNKTFVLSGCSNPLLSVGLSPGNAMARTAKTGRQFGRTLVVRVEATKSGEQKRQLPGIGFFCGSLHKLRPLGRTRWNVLCHSLDLIFRIVALPTIGCESG